MTRGASVLTVILLGGCVLSRPEFVEPKWGDAPAPLPMEITEVTQVTQRCVERSCQVERLVLRRDGPASREFRTGKTRDSLLLAEIDSVAFRQLAESLVRNRFFLGYEVNGELDPLTSNGSESILLSAATLCRRKVTPANPRGGYDAREDIAEAIAGLEWRRCCGHYIL